MGGLRRDAIGAKHGLSAGTVTNIVQECEVGMGKADADEIRELAVALKKLGIAPPKKQVLEQEIQRLESEASEARRRLDNALKEEAATMKEIDEFFIFKREINKRRIPMEDLPSFVKNINGIRQLGYDPNTILSKFSDFERLQVVEKELMDRVNDCSRSSCYVCSW